ncbi:39S ribosomal protein L10, mitochondrial [Frankliniella fusca]|uniref:Large ribosomal subunit protein uL10m n=1 Tax=Frankliniella fusca TaxID=407009 RepID=A0AAE1HDS5_9NEOP|nr:39S ribosomal protein L10, mitochondrial [Frankliniella fusca]
MSSSVMKVFSRVKPVIQQQIRYGSNRPNIQRPKTPSIPKLKFLALTKHMEAEDTRPPVEKCLKPVQKTPPYELDALEKIYASELRDLFRTSKLSAVFHRTGFHYDQLHNAKIQLFKANMRMVIRNKYIVKEAIGDTEFRNLLPLFESANFIAFSSEADLASLAQINKKLTHYHLLCAVVDRKILSVSQIDNLSIIPNIDAARAVVLQTLLRGPQNVAQHLQSLQNTLVQQLNQRLDQLQASTKE